MLQKAGKKVVIAEANTLCFGTTGGTTAHINSFFDKSYDQIEKDFGEEAAKLIAEATKQARELFKTNVEDYKIDCGFEEKDGYVYAQTEEQVEELESMFAGAKETGH